MERKRDNDKQRVTKECGRLVDRKKRKRETKIKSVCVWVREWERERERENRGKKREREIKWNLELTFEPPWWLFRRLQRDRGTHGNRNNGRCALIQPKKQGRFTFTFTFSIIIKRLSLLQRTWDIPKRKDPPNVSMSPTKRFLPEKQF